MRHATRTPDRLTVPDRIGMAVAAALAVLLAGVLATVLYNSGTGSRGVRAAGVCAAIPVGRVGVPERSLDAEAAVPPGSRSEQVPPRALLRC